MVSLHDLAVELDCPNLIQLCRQHVYHQVFDDDSELSSHDSDVDVSDCPEVNTRVRVYTSVATTFYAPSELAGWRGMHREMIRCTETWRGQYRRRDTVLVQMNQDLDGFHGMHVGRVFAFFELLSEDFRYPCALIQWFANEDEIDDVTGMWIVEPEYDNGRPSFAVISLDSIVRACHLIPVYGDTFLPHDLHSSASLDAFQSFYLNHYIDYHSHELL